MAPTGGPCCWLWRRRRYAAVCASQRTARQDDRSRWRLAIGCGRIRLGWAGRGGSSGAGGTGDGGPLLNGGLGRVCNTDADCPTGLTCNLNPEDWISHRQCSTFCDTSDFCESKFGSHTMCIGANLCMSKCLDDTDCPPTTRCNSNDWCENTGPGSGVPKCTGTPTPCSLLGQFECSGSLGCTWSGDCTGVSSSCFSQYDSYSCTSQEGCYWSSSSSSCSGSSWSCSLFSVAIHLHQIRRAAPGAATAREPHWNRVAKTSLPHSAISRPVACSCRSDRSPGVRIDQAARDNHLLNLRQLMRNRVST